MNSSYCYAVEVFTFGGYSLDVLHGRKFDSPQEAAQAVHEAWGKGLIPPGASANVRRVFLPSRARFAQLRRELAADLQADRERFVVSPLSRPLCGDEDENRRSAGWDNTPMIAAD